MNLIRRSVLTGLLAAGAAGGLESPAMASAASLAAAGKNRLAQLYEKSTKAIYFKERAKAILIFPRIYKAGFMVGAQTGDGVLFEHGRPTRYYNISAASFGLQAGGQAFSYALFFMKESALAFLEKSDGWAIGSGPSIVVIDKGAASSSTSTTLTQDVVAFPFGQSGLMAGLGLEGSKITAIHPK
jgi:lipid-binding SYLF domain-containing protein